VIIHAKQLVSYNSVNLPCVWVVHIDKRAVLTADIDETEIVVHQVYVVRVGPEPDRDSRALYGSAFIVDPSHLRLNRAREILIEEVPLSELFGLSNNGVTLVGMSRRTATKISGDHAKVIDPEFLVKCRIIFINDILKFQTNFADIGFVCLSGKDRQGTSACQS